MHALFCGISVIPVLTIERERDAVPLARALFEGGLPVIEITLRTAAAPAAIAAITRRAITRMCRTALTPGGRCRRNGRPTEPRRGR